MKFFWIAGPPANENAGMEPLRRDNSLTQVSLRWKAKAACVAGMLVFVEACAGLVAVSNQLAGTEKPVRPCKVTEQEASTAKRSGKRNKGRAEDSEASSTACVEVRSSPLDAQEQLQAAVREERWRVGDEEVSEALWSFSLTLTPEELLRYAKQVSTTEHARWTEGKALVLVKSTEVSDAYTRTTVSARFEGYGEPEDAFATKRASWAFTSNGKLESALTGLLERRLRAKH